MKPFLIILFSVLLISGCEKDISSQFPYTPPIDIGDGLKVGTLEEVGMDEDMLRKAVGRIHQDKYGEIHSMLIYKDDRLVFEDYYAGHQYQWDASYHHGKWITWDRDMLHDVKSVTKSVTATCIGIAIDQGFIESVDQSIFDYLPEYQHLNTYGKDQITIEHLLTMTSGLEWEEWGVPLSSSDNDIIGLWFNCEDPVSCIVERSLVSEPGTNFMYSGGNSIVLGEIIKNATKMPIDEYADAYLFEPLGIDSSNWTIRYPNGVIETAGSLALTPRAMTKVGVLYLNKGIWNGKQIISEEWVDKCVSPYPGNTGIRVPGEDVGKVAYSYSWWIKRMRYKGQEINWCFALGWGGQKIIALPELNMVIVFTGANYTSSVHEFEIFEKYILPAVSD